MIKTSFITLAIVSALAITGCSKEGPPQQAATSGADAAAQPAAAATTDTGQPQASAEPGTASDQARPAAADTRLPSSNAAAPATASDSPAPAAPVPTLHEVTIPAGTPIRVTLVTPLASDTSKVEDAVSGTVGESIIVAGTTVVPRGTPITGTVLEANQSGRVKGLASVAFQFDRLDLRGENVRFRTARVTREAAANRKEDVKKGGIGAGVGAIVGGIAGGGKGAAIGGAIGGTGAVLATRGEEVRLSAGAAVDTTLRDAVTVLVPVD